MRNYPYHFEYQKSYTVDINSFYKNLNGTSFRGLNKEKLIELLNISKTLNAFYKNNNIPINRVGRYVKIMNRIKTNPKGYSISNEAEKYLLFMFSVDPSFEAAKIHGECNKIEETKQKMERYFGIYDRKLIILENFFIKHFLSEKKRNEINDEIEKRVFK